MAQWKVIETHPNYEISSMGMVRNARTGRYLNPYDDGQGYLRVKLDGENCRVHILVALAFVPNPDPETKIIVNHKKGKKDDPRASQLEWVTPSENTQHAWETGLIKRGGVKAKWQHEKKGKLTRLTALMVVIIFMLKNSTNYEFQKMLTASNMRYSNLKLTALNMF